MIHSKCSKGKNPNLSAQKIISFRREEERTTQTRKKPKIVHQYCLLNVRCKKRIPFNISCNVHLAFSKWKRSKNLQERKTTSRKGRSIVRTEDQLLQSVRTGTPRLGLRLPTPRVRCLPMQSPSSSEFSPRGTGPDQINFLPFKSNYMCVFLTASLYSSPSATLHLVFRDNYFTCRCVFDVLVVRR